MEKLSPVKFSFDIFLQIAVTCFFVVLSLVVVFEPFYDTGPDGQVLDSSDRFVYSVNTTEKWLRGWNGGAEVTEQGLVIAEGRESEEIVHTVAFGAYSIDEVTIWVEETESSDVSAMLAVSPYWEFTSRDDYIRTDEEEWDSLSEGENSFAVEEYEDPYYRIYLDMNRQQPDDPSPLVKNITVRGTGLEDSQLVYPYN